MTPYFTFFILEIGLLAFLATAKRRITQNFLAFIFIFILILFAGLRGMVGIDTASYHLAFEAIDLRTYSFSEWFAFEPLFSAFMIFIRAFLDDPHSFIFFIALIQGILIFLISRKHPNKAVFLALYISGFYIQNQFNIIRAGLAGLFLVYAYTQKREGKDNTLPLILGSLCHYSAVIAVPFLFDLQHKYRMLALLVIGSALLMFMEGFDRISGKLMYYFIDSTYFSSGNIEIGPFFIVTLALILLAHLLANRELGYQIHFLIVFVIVLKFMQMRFPVLWRAYDLLYFVWLSITSYSIGNKFFSQKSIPLLLICLISLWYVTFNSLLHESEDLLKRSKQTGEVASIVFESPLVPYRTLFDDH